MICIGTVKATAFEGDGSAITNLPEMTGDSGSGGVKGVVPAPASGDAAAGKFLKADGTWETPSSEGFGIVPIGSIQAWHKDLSGVSLPDGWVECNGQLLSDPESPLNGETIPDLNGESRFLRGSSTSGTLQDVS